MVNPAGSHIPVTMSHPPVSSVTPVVEQITESATNRTGDAYTQNPYKPQGGVPSLDNSCVLIGYYK